MTTIVFRDGVLCSDSLVTQDGIRVGVVEKVWKTSAGILAGYAGNLNDMATFRRWTEGGCDGRFKQKHDGEGIVVQPDGSVFMVEGEEAVLAPIQTAFTALGTGAQLALGAMGLGAIAEQALMVAIAGDIYSGGNRIVVKTHARIKAEDEAKAQAEAAHQAAAKAAETEKLPGQEATEAQVAAVLSKRKPRRAPKLKVVKQDTPEKPDDQPAA